MLQLTGGVSVITGGASGIGFGLAQAIGRAGGEVLIAEPDPSRLGAACERLQSEGIKARWAVCDVRDPASVEALAKTAFSTGDRVSLLVNNAGVSTSRVKLQDKDLSEVRALFDINFFGVWHGCAAFAPYFIEQGEPAGIYNLASENAFFCAVSRSAAYIASKHAVVGLTESFREDVPDFMAVGAIYPGFVQSEMTAGPLMDRGMTAEDFGAKILPQIEAGETVVVAHPYNIVHIEERFDVLKRAHATYAPRYAGDESMDVRLILQELRAKKR